MAIETFDISVGTSNAGQSLKAQLVDATGVAVGSAVTTGFAMPTANTFTLSIGTWTGTIPDDFQGSLQIKRASDNGIVFIQSINPAVSNTGSGSSSIGPIPQTFHVQTVGGDPIPYADVSLTNGSQAAWEKTDGDGNVTLGVYADTWVLTIIKEGKSYTPTSFDITSSNPDPITVEMTDESTPVSWLYASQQDVEDAISTNNLVVASRQDGEDETIDSARVLRAGLWADAYINKALGKVYITPLQNMSADDAQIINVISVNLTVWMLSGWRLVQFNDQRVSAQKMFKSFKDDADNDLSNIVSSIIPFGATLVDTVTAPGNNQDAVDISGQRMYAKPTMYPDTTGRGFVL